jgi:hypothetical protein
MVGGKHLDARLGHCGPPLRFKGFPASVFLNVTGTHFEHQPANPPAPQVRTSQSPDNRSGPPHKNDPLGGKPTLRLGRPTILPVCRASERMLGAVNLSPQAIMRRSVNPTQMRSTGPNKSWQGQPKIRIFSSVLLYFLRAACLS